MNAKHFGLMLAAMMLTGCAFSTARVDLSYRPVAGAKSPLSELRPMTIALQVDDDRDPRFVDRLGDKINGLGDVTATIQSKSDVPAALFEALKAELENSGHRLVGANSPADATVRVTLKRYWCETKIRSWDVEVVATVKADVTVADPPVTRPLSSSVRESHQAVVDSTFQKVLNAALAEFVREFALDSQLIAALHQRQENTLAGSRN